MVLLIVISTMLPHYFCEVLSTQLNVNLRLSVG